MNNWLRWNSLLLIDRLWLERSILLINRFRLPALFRYRLLRLPGHLRFWHHRLLITNVSHRRNGILRLGLNRRRLLPRFIRLYRWLCVLICLRIPFWSRRDSRFTSLWPRRRLPCNCRSRLNRNCARCRRGLHQWINGSAPGLRCCSGRRSSCHWLCYRVSIEQRIEFIIFWQRRPISREQDIIRIGNDATGAVFYFIFIIHAFAGEQRSIGVTPKRVGKFFSQALTAR